MTAHAELDQHDPEQACEGQGKGEQVHQEADDDELPEVRGHEELADLREGDEPDEAQEGWGVKQQQEQDLEGGEVSYGEDLCRCLIAIGAVAVELRGRRGGPGGLR